MDHLDAIVNLYRPQVKNLHVLYQDDHSFQLELIYYDDTREIIYLTAEIIDPILNKAKYIDSLKKKKLCDNIRFQKDDKIASIIIKEYPVLDKAHFRMNVVGDVQSGKSRFMMAALWMLTYIYDLRCVLILMNQVESYNQVLLRDIILFNRWLHEHGETTRKLRVNGIRGVQENPVVEKNRIIICMGNSAQLKKIVNRFDDTAVVCDEADTLVKHWKVSNDKTKSGKLFEDCVKKSKSVWSITATPFALLNQEGVACASWMLPKSDKYRGLNEFETHQIDDRTAEKLKKDDVQLVELTRTAIKECSVRGVRPYLGVLVNARSTMKGQKQLAKRMAVFNGIESYIINSDSPCFIKHCDATGVITGTLFKTVSALFDHFEELGRDGLYREHVIIANRTANRAVSFRPSPLVGNGGLVVEILIPSKQSHCASLIQSLRAAGKYDYDYPPIHFYTSETCFKKMMMEQLNIETWVKKNETYGIAREQITDTLTYMVGAHDRATVDDTRLTDKHKITNHDFDTLDDLISMLPIEYKYMPITWMTEPEAVLIHEPEFVYTSDRRIQGRLRKKLKPVGDTTMQVAWNEARYKMLHDMKERFGNARRQYLCNYIIGDGGVGGDLYRVSWKPEFTDNRLLLTHFRGDMLYLFRTSRNKIRFYNYNFEYFVGNMQHSMI